MNANSIRIGIDLGGTKIEGIALDKNGEIIVRLRLDTPSGDYKQTLLRICELIDAIENTTGPATSIGIGTPGSIDRTTQLMRNANSTCLNGMPIVQDLKHCLHRDFKIANDADCFTLSEASDGAAKNYDTVFGVIIGTGTGGGVSINKTIGSGHNGLRGEWGHNPLPWISESEFPGRACYCGKKGCIETFLSGPGLSQMHFERTGTRISAREIAIEDSKQCRESIEWYCDLLARSLASVINILDPDAIVLGGGLSNIERIYDRVPALWEQYVFSGLATTPLLKPSHGDSSGVRGAAWIGADRN